MVDIETFRAWSSLDATTGCWEWLGATDADGYGRRPRAGYSSLAHRQAYEVIVGPIPEGMELDHLCRNRACVNPDHLEPVTRAENNRRSHAARARKPACVNGHLFTEANTRYTPGRGGRVCRKCAANRSRDYKRRREA